LANSLIAQPNYGEFMIRVVIIDDEPKAITSLEWELETRENQYRSLENLEREELALKELINLQPDCIFLDIEMPGLDGFRFFRAFSQS